MARGALEDVRGIATRLRPGVLDDLGLVAALTSLCTDTEKGTGIRIRRRIEDVGTTSHDQDLAAYRVAQEALTNVVRHSGAREARVALVGTGGGVSLDITDDGRGYQGTDGTGLTGMRERAHLVGGTLEISSAGGGTRVHLHVPTDVRGRGPR